MDLSKKAKREIKAHLDDLRITNIQLAKKANVATTVVSRALNPMQPQEEKVIVAALAIIKNKRPDIDIDALINA